MDQMIARIDALNDGNIQGRSHMSNMIFLSHLEIPDHVDPPFLSMLTPHSGHVDPPIKMAVILEF